MSYAAIPTLRAVVGYLPYLSTHWLVGAVAAPIATGIGILTLLSLTEHNSNANASASLAARIQQLAFPMFIGFLLGGCPGMMAAVGLQHLYEAYTKPPDSTPYSTPLHITTLIEEERLSMWQNTFLTTPEENWPSPQTIQEGIQSQLSTDRDPIARLQTAWRLGTSIPMTDGYKTIHSTLLSTSFKALFTSFSKDPTFQSDDITTFWALIPDALKYISDPTPHLQDMLRLLFLLKRFDSAYSDANCTRCVDGILSYIITRLNPAKYQPSLDELVELSCILSWQEQHLLIHTPDDLRVKLMKIVHTKEASATTPADRLKIAQIHDILLGISTENQARKILRLGIQGPWLDPMTPPSSLEELAVLVGTGYLELSNPRVPGCGSIGRCDYRARCQNINSWFEAAIRQQPRTPNTVEAALRYLRQLHWEGQQQVAHPQVVALLTSCIDNDTPPTIDELLQWYILCYSPWIPPRSGIATSQCELQLELLELLRDRIATTLDCALALALESQPNRAVEIATKATAAAHNTCDYALTHMIVKKCHDAVEEMESFIDQIESEVAQRESPHPPRETEEQTRQRLHRQDVLMAIGGIVFAYLR